LLGDQSGDRQRCFPVQESCTHGGCLCSAMHDEMPSSIKLTKASRRQWLVYATLNVLTGGARRKRPRCFKLVGTMSGVVSRSRCRCRCLETTSQCLSARLSHAARQSDCGVHNKRQQCHQAVQMNDDDTHAKQMRLARDEMLASFSLSGLRRLVQGPRYGS
jgi:hypothetical protein